MENLHPVHFSISNHHHDDQSSCHLKRPTSFEPITGKLITLHRLYDVCLASKFCHTISTSFIQWITSPRIFDWLFFEDDFESIITRNYIICSKLGVITVWNETMCTFNANKSRILVWVNYTLPYLIIYHTVSLNPTHLPCFSLHPLILYLIPKIP